MDKLISKFFEMIEGNKYKDIINLSSWIFMIIAPSYLAMFIHSFELFKELDNIKLLLVCIIINSFLLFILLIVIYNWKEYRKKYDGLGLNEEILKESIITLKSLVIIITILIFVLKPILNII